MNINKLLWFALSGFGVITALTLVQTTPAAATPKQYYWDGSETIVVKHPYFTQTEECKSAKNQGKPCNEGARFTLDRNSRTPWRFVAENANDTIRASSESSCTFFKYYLDVSFTDDGQARSDGVRVPNGDDAASVQGGSTINLGANNEACQIILEGRANSEGLKDGLEKNIREAVGDLNQPFTISGKHGQDGALSALEDQMKRMYEREKKHFVQRVCSTFKDAGTSGAADNPNCNNQEAEKAYSVIWNYCKYKARSLAKEDQRVAEVKSCIQNQSGVSANNSILDDSNFNIITYADGESCTIRFIGWIICPLSRFLANITDAAFDGLSQFLTIRPLNRGERAGDALYSAWSLINNIANVIFIIAFLVIIFSHVTGQGLSNYNIKRILPRLILTAILVNISYYICIIAVDLSNILGKSLIDIISSLEPDAVNKPSTWSAEVENILVFTAGAAGVGMVLLTGSIVAMVPLLVGAALSFLVAILMIVARYALVIILIVAAPIAIACSLLPNTQKWYNQWYKLFFSMLILFPLISIVFGTSKIAGILVLNSSLSRSTGDITLQLFGLAIQALPLALTPILMKLSGGVLNRFGGVVSSRGFFGKTKERADNFAARKKDARDVKGLTHFGDNRRKGLAGLRDKAIQRRYRRKGLHAMDEAERNRASENYTYDYIAGSQGTGGDKTSLLEKARGKLDEDYTPKTKGEKFAEELAKGGGSAASVRAQAVKAQIKINTEEVHAEKMRLESTPGASMADFRQLATDGAAPEAIRQAAIELVTEQGSIDDINSVVKSSKSMTQTQRQVLVKGVTSNRVASRAAYYGDPRAANAILTGQVGSDNEFTQHVVAPSINDGEVSAERIGTMHTSALNEVHQALESGHVQNEQSIKAVSDAAKAAQSSNSIMSKSHGTAEAAAALDRLAKFR